MITRPTTVTIETQDVGLFNELKSFRDLEMFKLGSGTWFLTSDAFSTNKEGFDGKIVFTRVLEMKDVG